MIFKAFSYILLDGSKPNAIRIFSSVQPKPRGSRIFSGICVQRLPVITKERSELEKRYEELQDQLELEHSALSEDEVQCKEILEQKEKHKDDDNDESIAIAISEAERKVQYTVHSIQVQYKM